jgi:hypothetical protein
LGAQRSGFVWEASTDAAWLKLTPLNNSAGDALLVAVPGNDLPDGVYTTTIRANIAAAPESAVEASVTYVRGAVQSVYLPAVVRDSLTE